MRSFWLLVPLGLATAACRSTGDGAAGGEAAQQARVLIEGNRTFGDDELHEVIAEDLRNLERRSSPKSAVDDAAFSLELHYRERGFPSARVEYEIDATRAPDLHATLIVEEGPRVRVTAANFAGNASIRSKELLPFVLQDGGSGMGSTPTWFSWARVRNGLGIVQAYYRSRGFLDARVALVVPEPERSDWSAEVELEIRVEEGPRWILREITLTGGHEAVDRTLDRSAFLGRPLTPRTAGTLRALLRELYGKAGYPDAEVEAGSEDTGRPGDARVHVRIVPGPLVRIAGVDLAGNEHTDSERVLGSLELGPGERYDAAKERESVRNLYDLGVFSSVGTELTGAGEERRLSVRVEERETRELYVEPGYGSYERLRLGLGWRELNLGGTARRLELEGTVSELAQRGELGLTDPRFRDSAVSANVSIFGEHREEPSFTETSTGAKLGFTRELSEILDVRAGYQYSFSRLDASDVDEPSLLAAEDDVNISSLSFSPRWDTRDSSFVPSTGILVHPYLEWADELLGSELDFLRFRWTLAWFHRLSGQTVFALSWRGGVIAPTGSTTTIPLQERFFNGGESTVRSFEEDQLGPKDASGSPIGGEVYDVFTAELRQELLGHVEGALFADTGNVVEDYADFWRFEDFRSGIGVGLRYMLPVGPLRVDVGFNPDPRDDEADYATHFSVGFSF